MTDQRFYEHIKKFNAIYKLESSDRPQLLGSNRVRAFHDILTEEIQEGLELAQKYEKWEQNSAPQNQTLDATALLTELADWLGDIIVYCASEARRWGLPLSQILEVIMQSNFSKLDEHGQPIYDHRGKVMKGPNYWKPEPKISTLLQDTLRSPPADSDAARSGSSHGNEPSHI